MKRRKSETVLWLFCKHDAKSFNNGFRAKESDDNPYLKNTNEWYSWNHGYNTNQQNKLINTELTRK